MRDNGPVTHREIQVGDEMIIVSGTDTSGRITFANADFVRISGYSEHELVGAPHNILRHPDMPAEAFADLWRTLKAGRPWEGLVKNRTKNGDHYWVRANVTPTVEGGVVTGYISIRTKPGREQVAAAEALYAAIRAGTARGIRIAGGRAVSITWWGALLRWRDSVVGRIGAMLLVLGPLVLGVGGLGVHGMHTINADLQSVFEDNVGAAIDLAMIGGLVADVERQVEHGESLVGRGADDAAIGAVLTRIGEDSREIERLWQAYAGGEHPEAEQRLQAAFSGQWSALRRDTLPPLESVLRGGEPERRARLLDEELRPRLAAVDASLRALVAYQREDADSFRRAAAARLRLNLTLMLGLLVCGGGLALGFGAWVLHTIRRPLREIGGHFEAIAAGDMRHHIEPVGVGEFDDIIDRLRALRARIAYFVLERAEISTRGEETLRREMMSLTEMLEGEVQETVGEISSQSRRLDEDAARLSQAAEMLLSKAVEVEASVHVTSDNVATVAGTTGELEASSREIAGHVDHSTRLAEAARIRGDAAAQRVSGLSEATAEIGNVVALIRSIAAQTRMLALNATIEAARAGEAGKGFVIVADEVKGLAGQTEQSIGTISGQAERIGATTGEAVETVQAVLGTIREIDSLTADVAHAAGQQRAATGAIMACVTQAADHTRIVAANVATMMEEARTTGEIAGRVRELSSRVSRDIGSLRQRLYVIMRASGGGDRRSERRIPVALKFTAEAGGQPFSGFTGDLSLGGALLVVEDEHRVASGAGWIELGGLGRIAVEIVSEGPMGLHAHFPHLDQTQRRNLQFSIDAAVVKDAPMMTRVSEVAHTVSGLLERALEQGEITREDLFDVDYRPIANTDPAQFLANHSALAERLFPAVIEPPLDEAGVVFCIAVDRNGYAAVHNRAASQPQRPDDPVWNVAHCRNRRIFDDRASILAARCLSPIVQTYCRDIGGGKVVVLKEFDAPVVVRERRWGAIRLATTLG